MHLRPAGSGSSTARRANRSPPPSFVAELRECAVELLGWALGNSLHEHDRERSDTLTVLVAELQKFAVRVAA